MRCQIWWSFWSSFLPTDQFKNILFGDVQEVNMWGLAAIETFVSPTSCYVKATDTANLSAANWGVIEVKGPWQLSLPDNVDLEDVLNDTRYREKVLEAVQQVCVPSNCRVLLNTGMLCSF